MSSLHVFAGALTALAERTNAQHAMLESLRNRLALLEGAARAPQPAPARSARDSAAALDDAVAAILPHVAAEAKAAASREVTVARSALEGEIDASARRAAADSVRPLLARVADIEASVAALAPKPASQENPAHQHQIAPVAYAESLEAAQEAEKVPDTPVKRPSRRRSAAVAAAAASTTLEF